MRRKTRAKPFGKRYVRTNWLLWESIVYVLESCVLLSSALEFTILLLLLGRRVTWEEHVIWALCNTEVCSIIPLVCGGFIHLWISMTSHGPVHCRAFRMPKFATFCWSAAGMNIQHLHSRGAVALSDNFYITSKTPLTGTLFCWLVMTGFVHSSKCSVKRGV